MAVLAVDPGSARHGLAVSDPLGVSSIPLDPLPARNERAALARLSELIAEWEVAEIVVGLPLNMDGSEGPAARTARAFGEKIRRATGLDVRFWDERLTTDEAERRLRSEGLSIRKRKERVDGRSAQIILQSYIESRKGTSEGSEEKKQQD